MKKIFFKEQFSNTEMLSFAMVAIALAQKPFSIGLLCFWLGISLISCILTVIYRTN